MSLLSYTYHIDSRKEVQLSWVSFSRTLLVCYVKSHVLVIAPCCAFSRLHHASLSPGDIEHLRVDSWSISRIAAEQNTMYEPLTLGVIRSHQAQWQPQNPSKWSLSSHFMFSLTRLKETLLMEKKWWKLPLWDKTKTTKSTAEVFLFLHRALIRMNPYQIANTKVDLFIYWTAEKRNNRSPCKKTQNLTSNWTVGEGQPLTSNNGFARFS